MVVQHSKCCLKSIKSHCIFGKGKKSGHVGSHKFGGHDDQRLWKLIRSFLVHLRNLSTVAK